LFKAAIISSTVSKGVKPMVVLSWRDWRLGEVDNAEVSSRERDGPM
jgi:hypothetical protein